MTATLSPQEAAFKERLAAAPEDETARLVYADWLEENDRSEEAAKQRLMAPGYRAWVQTGRKVCEESHHPELCAWVARASNKEFERRQKYYIPSDWFDAIELRGKYLDYCPHHSVRTDVSTPELLDAVALAFSKLPAERQAELLAVVPLKDRR